MLAPPTSISKRILKSLAADNNNSVNIHLTLPSVIATGLILFGTFVRLTCYKTLGEFFTYEITIRKNHKLITWGLYSWVRHPGYSSLIAIDVGLALSFATHGSWVRESDMLSTTWGQVLVGSQIAIIVIHIAAIFLRMDIEDAALRKAFPAEWNEWAEKVAYRLVPGIC
jgi:protein-S-isoprenylcysteine O-methyltransferase Ste14